jgi:hypothetical protein
VFEGIDGRLTEPLLPHLGLKGRPLPLLHGWLRLVRCSRVCLSNTRQPPTAIMSIHKQAIHKRCKIRYFGCDARGLV